MKRSILAAIVITTAAALNAYAGEAKKVFYSGHDICDIATINNTRMIPVRNISETLGYSVEWLGETKEIVVSRSNDVFRMKIGEDCYRTSEKEVSLGAAPIISNGSTYVPLTFLTELMNEKTVFGNNAVTVFGRAVITSVDSKSIIIKDETRGEIILNINDSIAVTNENGEPVPQSKLVGGTNIYVDYGDSTSLSLPPSNTPSKIVICE